MATQQPITDKSQMQTKRVICPRCQYVKENCICCEITPQNCTSNIIILQHPNERKHSKNSAKLVKLCIEHCQLIVGEQPKDFTSIQNHINHIIDSQEHSVYVVYPAEHAQNIEKLSDEITKPATLIFIDASWRKAYKMWQQNPWLQQLPTLTFDSAPKTRYQIRKHKQPSSLSTLEAVAYSLEQIEQANTKALSSAFDAMIAMHNRYRP